MNQKSEHGKQYIAAFKAKVVSEKEESSSYRTLFLCLDTAGLHKITWL